MYILCAHRENVHVNFHCRACATFKFCYKIASVPWKSAIFLCNQDVRARTMGCKRGLNQCVSLPFFSTLKGEYNDFVVKKIPIADLYSYLSVAAKTDAVNNPGTPYNFPRTSIINRGISWIARI